MQTPHRNPIFNYLTLPKRPLNSRFLGEVLRLRLQVLFGKKPYKQQALQNPKPGDWRSGGVWSGPVDEWRSGQVGEWRREGVEDWRTGGVEK